MATTPLTASPAPPTTAGATVSTRRTGTVLLVVAVWTAFVWVTFLRNLAHDHGQRTAFYVVHAVLSAVNLGVAVLLARIGWRLRRGGAG